MKIGPWVDRRVTNTTLLEELAGHDTATAAAVLTNRSLPAEAYLRIVGRTRFTVDIIRSVRPAQMLAGRTAAEQVALVLTTVEKSKAGVKDLCRHLSPEAALDLYHRTRVARFSGASVIAEAVAELAKGGFGPDADPDAVEALIVALTGGQDRLGTYLPTRAQTCPTAEDLLALAPRVAEVNVAGLQDKDAVDLAEQLGVIAYEHPEVLQAWAQTSDLGVLAAAAHPGVGAEYLTSLQAREDVGEALPQVLARNAVWATANTLAQLHIGLDAAIAAGNIHRFDIWAAEARTRLEAAQGNQPPFDQMDAAQLRTFIEANCRFTLGAPSKIAAFLHPNSLEGGSQTVFQLGRYRIPLSLRRHIMTVLDARPAQVRNQVPWALNGFRQYILIHQDAEVEQLPVPDLAEVPARSLLEVIESPQGERYSPAAPLLAERLTTAAQWRELARRIEEDNPNRVSRLPSAEELLEEIAGTLPVDHDAPASRYEALFGNPLGDLD